MIMTNNSLVCDSAQKENILHMKIAPSCHINALNTTLLQSANPPDTFCLP